VTDILKEAEALCAKLGDRRLYYANCGTVAEDFSRANTGNPDLDRCIDFEEVAHPQDPFWCEILVGANLLPGLVAEITRLNNVLEASQRAYDSASASAKMEITACKRAEATVRQQADYVGRLEKAFLEMYPLYKGTTDEHAQAALARIREGKS
jgi:hypothetical protein